MKFFVNFLSAFRIVASFIIPITMAMGMPITTFTLFILAALSDFFDGFLARKYNACTKLGTVLDSIADKFLIVNTFIMLCILKPQWAVIIPIIAMISRELYISGLREFVGTQKITPPHAKGRFSMGKIKTAMQMISIVAFLISPVLNMFVYDVQTTEILEYFAVSGLWIALIASIWSATEYTIDVVKKLKTHKR